MTEKEMTEAEKKEAREKAREVALKNLKNDGIRSLAAAYFVDSFKAKNPGMNYGEAGESAVELYKYLPGIRSPEGQEIVMTTLLGSRQGSKRYSGNVSEYGVIKTAGDIMTQSLGGVSIDDVMSTLGSKANVDTKYRGKYLSDLFEGSDEDQKVGHQILNGYLQNFTDTSVSEALNARAKDTVKGLEEVVQTPEPKKKQ